MTGGFLTEDVQCCVICGSQANSVIIENIRDDVCHSIEYSANIVRCDSCGHVYLTPVINDKDLYKAYSGYYTKSKSNIKFSTNSNRDLFSVFGEYYDYVYRGDSSFKSATICFLTYIIPFLRFFLRRAVRFIPIPYKKESLTLLDVGCGRGDFLMRASRCGYDVTGVDFDPETIDIARSRGMQAYVSDINNLSHLPQYDVVTLSHVIEHVKDPVQSINQIYKRLKPGGYLYISTPNIDSSGRRVFKEKWRGCDFPRHLNFFNHDSLERLLTQAGFSSVLHVYDLPQSLTISRSSMRIQNGYTNSFFVSIKFLVALIRKMPFYRRNLDVIVCKCIK